MIFIIDLNLYHPSFVSFSLITMIGLFIKTFTSWSQCKSTMEATSSQCWTFILQQLDLSAPVLSLPSPLCCPYPATTVKTFWQPLSMPGYTNNLRWTNFLIISCSFNFLPTLVQATQKSTSGHQMTVALQEPPLQISRLFQQCALHLREADEERRGGHAGRPASRVAIHARQPPPYCTEQLLSHC